MKLQALQRRMARAVMTPLTPSERMRSLTPKGRSMRAEAAAFIRPNDRLTSFERLEIYNRQYWFRIFSAMTDDFPGLRAVLGDRLFDALSKAYLRDCPSTSFTLRNLGAKLEGWLRKRPKFAGMRQKLAIDMVRLEWADIEAFDGQSLPPLKRENLANANPATLRLRLQPYVQRKTPPQTRDRRRSIKTHAHFFGRSPRGLFRLFSPHRTRGIQHPSRATRGKNAGTRHRRRFPRKLHARG